MADYTWDSEYSQDAGKEFTKIEEGTYPFKITNFERKTNRNGKDYAQVTIELEHDEGEYFTIKDNIYLNAAWRIPELFNSCGLTDPSQKRFTPQWGKLIGSRGTVSVAYEKGTDGKEYLRVQEYLVEPQEPEESAF